jgi:protein-S-isoprenylcysteine O-methyltransferase Ste14
MAEKRVARKLYDLAAVLPLITLNTLGIYGFYPRMSSEAAQLAERLSIEPAFKLISQSATISFLTLQIVLFAIRRLPERKAEGIAPRLAGLAGSNLPLLFLLLPRVDESIGLLAASTFLMVCGLGAAFYIAAFLGRCFSIFPQARGLATTGPYRFVRHPLYIAEQVATVGISCQYAQPWASIVVLASLAAQFPRMHYEERVLAETYPAYRAYMSRTPRIVPRLNLLRASSIT